MRYVWMGLLIVLVVVLLAFAFVNGGPTTVEFPFVQSSMTAPTFAVMLIFYVLGMLSGWSVYGFLKRSIRKASEHRHQGGS